MAEIPAAPGLAAVRTGNRLRRRDQTKASGAHDDTSSDRRRKASSESPMRGSVATFRRRTTRFSGPPTNPLSTFRVRGGVQTTRGHETPSCRVSTHPSRARASRLDRTTGDRSVSLTVDPRVDVEPVLPCSLAVRVRGRGADSGRCSCHRSGYRLWWNVKRTPWDRLARFVLREPQPLGDVHGCSWVGRDGLTFSHASAVTIPDIQPLSDRE
jgi:hypothetical protein